MPDLDDAPSRRERDGIVRGVARREADARRALGEQRVVAQHDEARGEGRFGVAHRQHRAQFGTDARRLAGGDRERGLLEHHGASRSPTARLAASPHSSVLTPGATRIA